MTATFKNLVDYFKICDSNEQTPSSATSQLLALSLLSSICARVFRVDGFAPDMYMISNDDTDLIRAKLRTLSTECKKLDMSFNSSVKAIQIVRAALRNTKTSQAYVKAFGAIRHRADNEQRRKLLGDIYKATEALNVVIEGEMYKIENPACTSIVLDLGSVISTYMTKHSQDKNMDRYVFDISRRETDISVQEYESKPSYEVLRYLNDIIEMVNTLSAAGVVIDIEMTARARNLYDTEMPILFGEQCSLDTYVQVKKIAALYALARSVHDCVIDARDVSASLELVRRSRSTFELEEEDLTEARAKALYERVRLFLTQEYGAPGSVASRNSKPHLHALGMVPLAHVLNSVSGLKLFAKHKTKSKKQLVDDAIRKLVDDGMITILHEYHPLAMGNDKGRIFSRIAYVHGFAVDRMHEWEHLEPVYGVASKRV